MRTKTITRAAVCISLGIFLSMIKIIHMPLGGSITLCSNLFLVLPGYWFGTKIGIICACIAGLIKFLLNPVLIHPAQFFLDYILGFASLGLGQIAKINPFCRDKNSLANSFLFCMTLKFLCCLASGLIFFRSYSPKNFSPWIYCLLYNLFYVGGESIITVILISLPAFKNMIKYLSVYDE